METIKVNTSVIKDKAGTYRAISSNIMTLKNEINAEINMLDMDWYGQLGKKAISTFRQSNNRLDEMCAKVNEFALFLDKAADKYEATEAAIVKNAAETAR